MYKQHTGQRTTTEDAAFWLTDSVYKTVNQKINVGGIFCDLAVSFSDAARLLIVWIIKFC